MESWVTDWFMEPGKSIGGGFDCGWICCRGGAVRWRGTLMAFGTWTFGARDEALATVALTEAGVLKRC